jgi:ceramide glucosyltransferase
MAVVFISLFLAFSLFVISLIFTSSFKRTAMGLDYIPEDMIARVSILKPVKKADCHFEDNIRTFYQQDYPDFEIVFGLETESDPEAEIITKVAIEYPSVKTIIVYTGTKKELNPKVDNLVKMEQVATGTHYWIADANVSVEKNVLSSLMYESLINGSKLVFCPIRGSGSSTMASLAENMHLSFTVSGLIIGAWSIAGRQITVGKSMLVEKSTLVQYFGGFSYFLKYLAEDYMLGKKYEKRKIPLSTNYTWITNINSNATFKSFFSRMTRWGTMRYHIDRKWYFAEMLLMNPTVVSIALFFSGNIAIIQSALFVILFKMFCEFLNFRYVNKNDSRRIKNIMMFVPAFFAKEFIIAFSYLIPLFSRRVTWKGKKIRVGKNSIINYQDIPELTALEEL